jgi:hypothetical protein
MRSGGLRFDVVQPAKVDGTDATKRHEILFSGQSSSAAVVSFSSGSLHLSFKSLNSASRINAFSCG